MLGYNKTNKFAHYMYLITCIIYNWLTSIKANKTFAFELLTSLKTFNNFWI